MQSLFTKRHVSFQKKIYKYFSFDSVEFKNSIYLCGKYFFNMEAIAINGSLQYLFRKIESLPAQMQADVSLFADFLITKCKTKPEVDFNTGAEDNHFSSLSLSTISKEWSSPEDEEWDTILSQMPSIQ